MTLPSVEWVMATPLDQVCLLIADRYLDDKSSLDGDILASLAKRLIDAESQPGGPYENADGIADLCTNLAIGYLFLALGKPLPLVTAFIESKRADRGIQPQIKDVLKRYDRLQMVVQRASQPDITPDPLYVRVETTFRQLEEPLKEQGLAFLHRVQRADTDTDNEISHLATLFENSLLVPDHTTPLALLGEANIYCWIAYMAYDHIIDGDLTPSSLPMANVAMRRSYTAYASLVPVGHPFRIQLDNVFDAMDHTNAWEVANTRAQVEGGRIKINSLPRYGHRSVLARRSFGHALGPMALTYLHQFGADQRQFIEQGFRHYLIARQLNDDMHDWREDIRAGHISAVVVHILRDAKVVSGTYDMDDLITRMQQNFWQRSMETMNVIIHNHINRSLDCFSKSQAFQSDNELFALVKKQANVATGSSRELARYQNFSTTYKALST